MLGHRLPRHGEALAKLDQRLPVVGTETVEQLAPSRVGQRLEHQIHGDNMQPIGCLSSHAMSPRLARHKSRTGCSNGDRWCGDGAWSCVSAAVSCGSCLVPPYKTGAVTPRGTP
jgi:hypothetical protein